MKEWLPKIINMKADPTLITAEMRGKIQLTQQRLLNLAETADNSSAQVGALRASVDAINSEADFLFKTGQINAVPQRIEQKIEGSQDLKITVVDEVARNQMDPSPGAEKPTPK